MEETPKRRGRPKGSTSTSSTKKGSTRKGTSKNSKPQVKLPKNYTLYQLITVVREPLRDQGNYIVAGGIMGECYEALNLGIAKNLMEKYVDFI